MSHLRSIQKSTKFSSVMGSLFMIYLVIQGNSLSHLRGIQKSTKFSSVMGSLFMIYLVIQGNSLSHLRGIQKSTKCIRSIIQGADGICIVERREKETYPTCASHRGCPDNRDCCFTTIVPQRYALDNTRKVSSRSFIFTRTAVVWAKGVFFFYQFLVMLPANLSQENNFYAKPLDKTGHLVKTKVFPTSYGHIEREQTGKRR